MHEDTRPADDYIEHTEEFVRSGRVEKAAEDAESALDSTEGSGLREAEQIGKSRAKEEDR